MSTVSTGAPLLEVLHGVNFNLLHLRDPAQYGSHSLAQLEQEIAALAHVAGFQAHCFQTNSEQAFVERLHRIAMLEHRSVDSAANADDARSDVARSTSGSQQAVAPAALIVNPGAWTHYAWAIHDALAIVRAPAVEVHLSAISTREPWRRLSVVSDLCVATIEGRGLAGYAEAIELLAVRCDAQSSGS